MIISYNNNRKNEGKKIMHTRNIMTIYRKHRIVFALIVSTCHQFENSL